MTQEAPHFFYEKEEHIAVLTINRPERMNALGGGVSAGLSNSIWDFRNDPEMRVLIITGAGERAFCAGGDLKEMAERAKAGGNTQAEAKAPPTMPVMEMILTTYDKPIIAALNGLAVGGGCEIACCCDFRIGTPTARIGITEGRVGLGGHYGTILLPRYLPFGIALQQMFTGVPLSAEECERWGLINKIVSHEELIPYCKKLAEEILMCAPLSVARQKHNAYKADRLPIPYAFDINAGPNVYGPEGTADRSEGARAFAEKRKPVWTGKV
jgi:enoyl-CoA hydratase/carnithine racemase